MKTQEFNSSLDKKPSFQMSNLKNKLFSNVALPILMVAVPTFSGSLNRDAKLKNTTAKAMDSYLLYTQGIHFQPGANPRLDSIAAIEQDATTLKSSIDKVMPRLSEDELYAKLSSAQKMALFMPSYNELRKEVEPDTISPAYMNVMRVCPLGDEGWGGVIVSCPEGPRNTKYDGPRKYHFGSDYQKIKKNGKRERQIGLPVRAEEDGTIIASGITNHGHTGRIVFQGDDGWVQIYDHVYTLDEIANDKHTWKDNVKAWWVGAKVKAGEYITRLHKHRPHESMIGHNPETGEHGEHLHVENRYNGVATSAGNDLPKTNGFLGKIRESKFAKKIGSFLANIIQSDPTGKRFAALPKEMQEKALAEQGKNTAKEIAFAFTAGVESSEIDYIGKGKKKRAWSRWGLSRKSLKGFNPATATVADRDRGYEKYWEESGVDTISGDPADPVRIARQVGEFDAYIQHGKAPELIREAKGDPYELIEERREYVGSIKKLHGILGKLMIRYDKLEKEITEIKKSAAKTGNVFLDPVYITRMAQYNDIVDSYAKKEFAKQQAQLDNKVAADMQELNINYATMNNEPEQPKKSSSEQIGQVKADAAQNIIAITQPASTVQADFAETKETVIHRRGNRQLSNLFYYGGDRFEAPVLAA